MSAFQVVIQMLDIFIWLSHNHLIILSHQFVNNKTKNNTFVQNEFKSLSFWWSIPDLFPRRQMQTDIGLHTTINSNTYYVLLRLWAQITGVFQGYKFAFIIILSSLNSPLSFLSTTSRELIYQFPTISGWWWLVAGGKWKKYIVIVKTVPGRFSF